MLIRSRAVRRLVDPGLHRLISIFRLLPADGFHSLISVWRQLCCHPANTRLRYVSFKTGSKSLRLFDSWPSRSQHAKVLGSAVSVMK